MAMSVDHSTPTRTSATITTASVTIGVALCTDELHRDLFHAQVLHGVVRAATLAGAAVVPFLSGDLEGPHTIALPRSGVQGLIVDARSSWSPNVAALISTGVPTIVIGRGSGVSGCQVIDADHARGADELMAHLIASGRRRIAVICGGLQHFDSILRLDSYERARRDAGLELDTDLVAMGDFSVASGRRAMERLLELEPDAVFAMNDLMALGAMHVALAAGRRIPHDLSICGFDDLVDTDFAPIPITTVRQPARRMGERAVRALLDLFDGAVPGAPEIVPVELVVRESSRRRLRLTVD